MYLLDEKEAFEVMVRFVEWLAARDGADFAARLADLRRGPWSAWETGDPQA